MIVARGRDATKAWLAQDRAVGWAGCILYIYIHVPHKLEGIFGILEVSKKSMYTYLIFESGMWTYYFFMCKETYS
jgi:hypothetical protein